VQALPSNITTHKMSLQRGLVVEEKFQRVANFALGMNRELEMIARLLRRQACDASTCAWRRRQDRAP
jgi:glutamate synthase domain-containing protein 2